MADYLPPEYRTTPGVKPERFQHMTYKEISQALVKDGINLPPSAVYHRVQAGISLRASREVIAHYSGRWKATKPKLARRIVWDDDSPCTGCPNYQICATEDKACLDYYRYVNQDSDLCQTIAQKRHREFKRQAFIYNIQNVDRWPREDVYRSIFRDSA